MQVICTRVIEAKIKHKTVPSVLCRVCGQSEETIVHLLAACPLLAAFAYLYFRQWLKNKSITSFNYCELSNAMASIISFAFPKIGTCLVAVKVNILYDPEDISFLYTFSQLPILIIMEEIFYAITKTKNCYGNVD